MNRSQSPLMTPGLSHRKNRLRRIALIAVPILLILVSVMFAQMGRVPADLDVSTSKLSSNGLYQVSYQATEATIPINQLQTWTLEVTTPDGKPVTDATVTLEGDMPQHGHGLPTSPIVTPKGNGQYLVEGLKFQMGGWWYTGFTIASAQGEDKVRFDFILKR
jgi:YtkA-like